MGQRRIEGLPVAFGEFRNGPVLHTGADDFCEILSSAQHS
jgi:hypothetical protein